MKTLEDIVTTLRSRFGEAILEVRKFRGETTVLLPAASLPEVCSFCRSELAFDFLLDITSIDNFGDDPRFEVVYELYSLDTHLHLRLKTAVSEDMADDRDGSALGTVTTVWPTADWHEREIYDMMGIRFAGHPDLRRILMWEGYPFHPLRKDFPLEGKPSAMPDIAFSNAAPLAGGPFVTSPTTATAKDREPRARRP